MGASTKAKAQPGPLERGLAKTAALDELYARLKPENGGHRPLTAEERKIQQANALSVAELDAVQKDLYSHWVAVDDCLIGGVLAFAAGQRVPTTHVVEYGWDTDGSVVPVDSTEGNAAETVLMDEAVAAAANAAEADEAATGGK